MRQVSARFPAKFSSKAAIFPNSRFQRDPRRSYQRAGASRFKRPPALLCHNNPCRASTGKVQLVAARPLIPHIPYIPYIPYPTDRARIGTHRPSGSLASSVTNPGRPRSRGGGCVLLKQTGGLRLNCENHSRLTSRFTLTGFCSALRLWCRIIKIFLEQSDG